MIYRLFRALASLTLHLFFRQIEVEGTQHIPSAGPVLFVSNHANALVDPLLLLISMHRRLTVTAKNVLARNPLLGLLMKALGVVTFHRRSDIGKGADPRQNVQSLQRCREILAAGGALCIFPEGVSHSDPKLRRFQQGPARLALDYVKEDGDPGGLRIVPVGLLYTEKDQFRSGVWLRFGEPLSAASWLAEHPEGDPPSLTAEIRRRVETLTLNYETRRESLILNWAGDIVATRGEMPASLGGAVGSAGDWFQLRARLQAGYRSLLVPYRDEVEALSRRVRRYRSELKRRGLAPAEVYLPRHFGRSLLFLVRELELILVGAPLALFGVANHLLPYLLVKRIARALSTDKDHWASNVVYPSFLLLPAFYLLQLTLAWLLLPTGWAALYSVALPYTGYYALLYHERAGSAFRRAWTFLRFLLDRHTQDELAKEGRAIIADIRALEARLRDTNTEKNALPSVQPERTAAPE